jgi:hypothetical protein
MARRMVELAFGIAAYAAHEPQSGTDPDVCWSAQAGGSPDPARPPVPQLLRRRVSPIGQAALRVAWALPQVERARFVFASRNGEFDRTLTMLDQVAAEDGPSPADFSLGVHNALPGLLSICARNHRGHTALAAGVDSFGFGLMEAAACLLEQPEDPVMLVYYDAALPPGYPDTAPACAEATLALAVVLVTPPQASTPVVMSATPAADTEPCEAAAVVFLRFLRTMAPEARATGERMIWHWRHV